jgi:hypothetical protein
VENTYYQINEEKVLFSQLDEEGVFLDIEKNQYLSLNQTFTSIFLYLQQGLGSNEVLAKLLEEYEVEEEECFRELEKVIKNLVEFNFILKK